MPQSLVKNYIHLVFSTKYRNHLIDGGIEMDLYSYMAGICANLDCYPVQVGGYTDHMHLLFLLNKKMMLVKAVEEIKSCSSKWIKTKGEAYKNFYWQNGYGAFSVNPAEIDVVIGYTKTQKQHHSKVSFQNEYRDFLERYGAAYDERYVWD